MSEQQTATAVQATTTSACQHPEAVGTRWGDPISAERQAELQGYLDRWAAETNHGGRKWPFDVSGRSYRERDRLTLTGADVFWLADQSGRGEYGGVPDLHLEGAELVLAHLEGADLHNARMDKATLLNEAALDRASLDQLSFDGANLAVVKWETVGVLGDEVRARATKDDNGKRKDRQKRINDYEAAVRAHLQLAAVLRSQGMRDQADRFSYCAQLLQRGVLRHRSRFGAALGSWLLDLISGYGYRPWRSFITYVLVILGFAAAYFTLGTTSGHSLSWNEAIVISMTAFHGRGFFSAVFQPGDLQAAVAAVEAFIGLLIEIVFIGAIRSLETVARRRGMRGIPTGVTTGGSLTGANSCPSW